MQLKFPVFGFAYIYRHEREVTKVIVPYFKVQLFVGVTEAEIIAVSLNYLQVLKPRHHIEKMYCRQWARECQVPPPYLHYNFVLPKMKIVSSFSRLPTWIVSVAKSALSEYANDLNI